MKQELFGSLFLVVLFSVTVFGQDQDKYLIGSEKKLEMIVHIMGEVRKPGEYRVEDDTNLVELMDGISVLKNKIMGKSKGKGID